MSNHYSVAFDVELDRLVPDSWNETSTPQITCAAVYSHSEGARLFYSTDENEHEKLNSISAKGGESKQCAPRLNKKDCSKLLDELWEHMQKGAIIISWGGTAVDFRALHSALQGDDDRQNKCVQLVRNHVDIPIASCTDIGMMMGLDAAAKGTGQGNKNNFTSTQAPKMWTSGKQAEVLEHVKLDAVLTLKVYEAVMKNVPPTLTWVTRSGKTRTWYCYLIIDHERKMLRMSNVEECLQRPVKAVPFLVPRGMNRDHAASWLHKNNS